MWANLTPMQKVGVGSAAGGAAGNILSKIFAYQNPADAAQPYLNQIPDTLKQYYQPYADTGNQSRTQLSDLYGQILKDPGAFLNNMGKSYQASPGFELQKRQGLDAINQSAAAGGMVGSPQNQQQAGEYATQLASNDYDKFLSHLFNVLGLGTSGETNLFNTGYNASSQLGQNLANLLMNQGNLAYSGVANENNSNAGMFGDIGSLGMLGLLL